MNEEDISKSSVPLQSMYMNETHIVEIADQPREALSPDETYIAQPEALPAPIEQPKLEIIAEEVNEVSIPIQKAIAPETEHIKNSSNTKKRSYDQFI